VGLYIHSNILLPDVVLNLLRTWGKLPFYVNHIMQFSHPSVISSLLGRDIRLGTLCSQAHVMKVHHEPLCLVYQTGCGAGQKNRFPFPLCVLCKRDSGALNLTYRRLGSLLYILPSAECGPYTSRSSEMYCQRQVLAQVKKSHNNSNDQRPGVR
jgi:hypothetical protein